MADVNTTICTERHHAGCHCHEARRDAELATTRAELTEMRQQWWEQQQISDRRLERINELCGELGRWRRMVEHLRDRLARTQRQCNQLAEQARFVDAEAHEMLSEVSRQLRSIPALEAQREALKGAVKRTYNAGKSSVEAYVGALCEVYVARDRLAGELEAYGGRIAELAERLNDALPENERLAAELAATENERQRTVDRFLRSESELAEANKELRGWRGCPSCMEDHPEGTTCPPHEVRTSGGAWRLRQTREWAKRAEGAERQLRNLLAIIHRDGGHHTESVGTVRSVEDAHQVWGELMQRAEEAERELSECRARNAELALTNEVAANRADVAEAELVRLKAELETDADLEPYEGIQEERDRFKAQLAETDNLLREACDVAGIEFHEAKFAPADLAGELAQERESLRIARNERDDHLRGLTEIHRAFGVEFYSWQRAYQLVEECIAKLARERARVEEFVRDHDLFECKCLACAEFRAALAGTQEGASRG